VDEKADDMTQHSMRLIPVKSLNDGRGKQQAVACHRSSSASRSLPRCKGDCEQVQMGAGSQNSTHCIDLLTASRTPVLQGFRLAVRLRTNSYMRLVVQVKKCCAATG
jgi:hypothetical protein